MAHYAQIDEVLEAYAYDAKKLVNILRDVQDVCEGRYISEAVAAYLSKKLNVTKGNIYEVVTFLRH